MHQSHDPTASPPVFREWPVQFEFPRYRNGRVAIQIIDASDGDPIATASVNLPDEPLAADEVAIKDYSENTGVLGLLISVGIVSEPVRFVRSGHVRVPICRLLVELADDGG